jgi:hypothetical protein
MKRFFFALFLAFASLSALGQSLTPAQRVTIRDSINVETAPAVVAARAIRDDYAISDWCNSPSATDAWIASVSGKALFEAMDITKYDSLTAGKRDSWSLMLSNVPLDMGRNKLRSAVVDVWGSTDSVSVLQAMREKATNCQMYLGGTSKTTNTVTGLDRIWSGTVSGNDMSAILNYQGN